eukprot:TRINITY_DN5199_c0_g1_i2.p1 TRINITY_DN5199_c0_g1~~TRINITY_DN5199_c0_g1_i2.p1  ORF type:complete len:601 (+),score=183.93 TRINITY_DN5199_c0_g1_i2:55-1803(+)
MAFTPETLSAEPYSQGHLFEGASDEEKASLAQQLSDIDAVLPGGGLKGYLERGRKLLADAKAGTNPFEGLTPKVPSGQNLTGASGPGSELYAELEKLGMAELSKACFCLVAGGLGERLGYPGIKIGIPSEVTTGMPFIEIYVRFILAFQEHARKATGDASLLLPLAIMTSGDTHEKTVELLTSSGFFGMQESEVTIMKQEKVPALVDIDARIAKKDGKIETKPHGHGDVHALLHQKGLTKKWAAEGKQWLVLFQDTNPLPFRSVCAVLGVSVKNQFVMNSVTVPRLPGEAVGGICTLEDAAKGTSLTINVEYNQLDPLLKATPTGGDVADASGFSPYPGNINILVFKVPEMDKCLETTGGIVPEFVNPKWADAEKSKFKSPTRLECMMQDFPRLCNPGDKVGFTQLDRLMCFTCVKNSLDDARKKNPPDCALSAESDIYAASAHLLALAGAEIEAPEDVTFLGITRQIGARIILQPSFGISLEQIKERVKGKVTISKKSALVVDGSVTLENFKLDGAAKVSGEGTCKDVTVENKGQALVALEESALAGLPPYLQIRGYNQGTGEVAEVKVSASGAAVETKTA